jgi:hypothetical protein
MLRFSVFATMFSLFRFSHHHIAFASFRVFAYYAYAVFSSPILSFIAFSPLAAEQLKIGH